MAQLEVPNKEPINPWVADILPVTPNEPVMSAEPVYGNTDDVVSCLPLENS
jgi:hypothetical protein